MSNYNKDICKSLIENIYFLVLSMMNHTKAIYLYKDKNFIEDDIKKIDKIIGELNVLKNRIDDSLKKVDKY